MTLAAATGLVLVLGGIRSGKSAFAERLAARAGERVVYVATGAVTDTEMAARIAAHRARRPRTWRTLDAPLGIAAAVGTLGDDYDAVLLDDLGMLVSNVMLAASAGAALPDAAECWRRLEAEVEQIAAAQRAATKPWIVVSSEAGSGLVPTSALGRQFVDLLGRANQHLARSAGGVYLMIAGYALDVLGLGQRIE